MTRSISTLALAGVLAATSALQARQTPASGCDPGNGGLTLPPGFCAQVIADDLGAARNLAVAPNGDIYVSIRTGVRAPGQPMQPGYLMALRDTNGDGTMDRKRALRHRGGDRPGAPERLPLLRDHALGRALQAHARRTGAGRTGRSGRRRLPRSARPRRQGSGLRRPRQSLRHHRPAVECLRAAGSPARREGRRPVPAARERRRRVEVQGRRGRAEVLGRRLDTPPACVRAWRWRGTPASCICR